MQTGMCIIGEMDAYEKLNMTKYHKTRVSSNSIEQNFSYNFSKK